jgi:nucleotide-binding universal stress UspA family protein
VKGDDEMKRILVALDHSPRATVVLTRAAAIARMAGAELYLLRAVGVPAELPEDAFRWSPNEVVERLRADATRELERLAGTLEPAQIAHVLVRIGAPWSAICEAAREHEVDLVVIGSHGYGAMDRVLGTTAAKVVNHADRSVLVVRDSARAA